MNKYGQAAVLAVKFSEGPRGLSPRKAWDRATGQLFGEGTWGQDKGCPRGAFLGLCEAGLVKGIPAGKYSRSAANKAYAVSAIKRIRNNPDLARDPGRLWDLVLQGESKVHNGQMDVAAALWAAQLIV